MNSIEMYRNRQLAELHGDDCLRLPTTTYGRKKILHWQQESLKKAGPSAKELMAADCLNGSIHGYDSLN